MKIAFYGDVHMDIQNIDRTLPALKAITQKIEAEKPDLTINLGDLVVSRGAIHPHVSFLLRSEFVNQAHASVNGLRVLKGNHDDTYHADRADSVHGIVGGLRDTQIALDSEPGVVVVDHVAFVMIPSPSKHAFAAYKASGGTIDNAKDALTNVVRGLITEAKSRPGVSKIIACYHGTVDGCTLDNEQQMPAGQDYSLPHDAFRGADLVMCGHIHKPQDWREGPNHPAGMYVGSIAPLAWGGKHEPQMVILKIPDNGLEVIRYVKLPVAFQMIETELIFGDDMDSGFSKAAHKHLDDLDIPIGSRVRLIVQGRKSVLQDFDPGWGDRAAQGFGYSSLKLIKEPIDDGLARLKVDRKWTILDVFKRWLGYKEIEGPVADEMNALAEEVERLVRDVHLDAHYDFKPKQLKATNWCQFPVVDIDFGELNGVAAVVGSNASGKSNLARLIPFALYKRQLSGRNLADLVRRGEKQAEVELDFEAHGQTYRIAWVIKVNSKGVATASLDFMRQEGSAWVQANEGTSRETLAAIANIVGPWEMFSWTCWSGQSDVDGLLDLTPSEMKDVLVRLMQRNWDARLDYGKKQIATFEAGRETAEAARQVIDETASQIKEVTAEKAERSIVLDGYVRKLAEIPDPPVEEQARLEIKLETALKDSLALQAAQDKAAGYRESYAEAMTAAEAAEARIADLQGGEDVNPEDIAQAMEDLDNGSQRLEDLIAGRDRIDVALETFNSKAGDERAKLEEGGREAIESLRALLVEYRGTATDCAAMHAETFSFLHDAENSLAAAKKAAGLIDGVPCGGKTFIGDESPDPIDMSTCQFLADAADQRGRIEELEATLTKLSGDLPAVAEASKRAHAEVSDTESKVNKETSRLQLSVKELLTTQDAKRTGLLDDKRRATESMLEQKGAVEEARARLAKLEAADKQQQIRGASLVAVRAQLATYQEQLRSIQKLLAEAVDLVADTERAGADVLEVRDQLEAAKAQVTQFKAQAFEMDTLVNSAREQVAIYTGRIAELDIRLEALKHIAKPLAHCEKMLVRWRLYCEAMDRDGLPFLLLEQFAIPALRERINEYLGQTEFRISISSERATQAGDLRNEVVMSFEDECGTHHLSAASGQQRTSSGMALRAALADLYADATGSTIHFAAQDEGFGTMDPVNLDGAKATVRQIANRRAVYFIISHVGGMDEAADSVIEIEKHGGHSTATIRK